MHGIYYKPKDKYVNICCRLKGCQFRINYKFELDAKQRPTKIILHQVSSYCHQIDSHQHGSIKELPHEVRKQEYRKLT